MPLEVKFGNLFLSLKRQMFLNFGYIGANIGRSNISAAVHTCIGFHHFVAMSEAGPENIELHLEDIAAFSAN